VSHHLDSPLARQNGQLYLNDLYVFSGDRGTVFIMDVNTDVNGADIQRGFHPEARYEFKVHFDGADSEDLTYRVSFSEPDADGQQTFSLHSLTGAEARNDNAAGSLILQGRTGGDIASDNGTRMWAGRIADPFYVDLTRVVAVNTAIKNGARLDQGPWRRDAKNSFAGKTVESIVLEVSEQHPMLHTGARIGVWCCTKLATDAGGWHQINRAGHPMMWPLFWPDDTDFSGDFNHGHPSTDFSSEGQYIAQHVATVVAANGTSADPVGYGQTVAQLVFPDVLSYVVGSPATYGFAIRNGRSLSDNAPEVMFSMMLNTPTGSGLGPKTNERQRTGKFPHVVTA
jgi:hypothetical protein